MNTTQVTAVEPGNRIQLPSDWADALGLHGLVALERSDNAIVVRPCPPLTWDEIFATGLTIGAAPPAENEDAVEMSGDDFVF